jgi:tetratricopeptide (TPR) repeat protein
MSKKIGRNDPCPCGSGKKYKRCCLPADERNERELRDAIPVPGVEPYPDGSVAVYTPLDLLSNRIGDLIRDGNFEEAEQAVRELKRRYPDEIDWIERAADLYEARGDDKKAAEHYRMAAEFMRTHPGFDAERASELAERAEQLDSHP